MIDRLHRDERGTSIAVTHVLTIGITAMLIVGLLAGAGSLLDSERERGAQDSLETIGERLAGEIASVDRMATSNGGNVSLQVDQPRRVSGSTYDVAMSAGDCNSPLLTESETCLVLTAHTEDVTVEVPLVTETNLDTETSVRGGPIEIRYDDDEDQLTLEGRR